MGLLKSVNVLLAVAFLLYSVECVYNAPINMTCGTGETLPLQNSAETLDDVLDITGRMITLHILNRLQRKDELLLFYEHMQTVAEAALSEELSSDSSRPAQALREVFEGLARAACKWASEQENTDMEGSGSENTDTEGSGSELEESIVDCDNVTDIVRFARQKEIDFIFSNMQDVNISKETLSLALRMRPIVNKTWIYLRNESPDFHPEERQKKAWVTRNISPANRCFVCQAVG